MGNAMPIYMRITQNGVPLFYGDVKAKGYEKWIELTSFGVPHLVRRRNRRIRRRRKSRATDIQLPAHQLRRQCPKRP
jgi:hypothetical protein